jgi:ABC-type uncharacterized transport system permease subunit
MLILEIAAGILLAAFLAYVVVALYEDKNIAGLLLVIAILGAIGFLIWKTWPHAVT